MKNKGEIGVWGGPARVSGAETTLAQAEEPPFIAGQPLVLGPDVQADPVEFNPSLDLTAQGSIRSQASPYGPGTAGSLLIYKVQPGDTLGKIAANFGITVESLMGANPEVKKLKVGQELNVLPVSGMLYHLQNGQSIQAAAGMFGLSAATLKSFNGVSGSTVLIPGASPVGHAQQETAPAGLPNLKGYFVKPTTGFNWGVLHAHNGVDIANVCGTNVVAAAEGLVTASFADGWNGGYGAYVLLEHPNGAKTRYAHLSKVFVSVGDYVNQSQSIGLMGSTGESTGCHLHFEVDGARNFMSK